MRNAPQTLLFLVHPTVSSHVTSSCVHPVSVADLEIDSPASLSPLGEFHASPPLDFRRGQRRSERGETVGVVEREDR